MQIAGAFSDQQLYFRKTNNDGTTGWSRFIAENGGKVGIRTVNPQAALQIGDSATSNQNQVVIPGVYNFERVALGQTGNGNAALEFVNHSSSTQSYGVKIGTNVDVYYGGLFITTAPTTSSYGTLAYNTIPAVFVGTDNCVGINTNKPNGYKLAVGGSMIAERVKVKLQSAWPDYVFHPDYELPSLQETAAYIHRHGHLPEVPAAATVARDGLDIGDMNATLLKKVEELTLHLLKQEEKIRQLEDQLNTLKKSSR